MSNGSAQAPSTRLSGRWLWAARLGWLLTLLVTLGLFVAAMPGYLVSVARTNPESAALSPGAVRAMAQIGISLGVYNRVSFAILCVVTLISLALAVALAWRRNDDWMALLVSLFLFNYLISTLGPPAAPTAPASNSLPAIINLVAESVVPFLITFAVFLLFPDGRFAPRWSWLILVAFMVWVAAIAARPNLFGGALFFGYPIVVGANIGCIVYRYRRASTPAQRQQTKWIVVGLVVSLLANQAFWIPTGFTPLGQTLYAPIDFLLYQVVLLLVPITFFIAIQRYRLYDIDAIINRALVYGALTAVLVGIYAGCVLGAQKVIAALTGDVGTEPAVIVATTLLVATLVHPLRNRLQALVDRRFYRSKYDAARTVAGFSGTLRHETELGALQGRLLETVERTMQPTHASIWLQSKPTDRPGAPQQV